jgi:hypothetical protein
MDTCPVNAAKLYLQGAGPWKLEEIGIAEDDPLVSLLNRYRAAVIEECARRVPWDSKGPSKWRQIYASC